MEADISIYIFEMMTTLFRKTKTTAFVKLKPQYLPSLLTMILRH